GQLEVMQWLRNSAACVWHDDCVTMLIKSRFWTALSWALTAGCPVPNEAMRTAAREGNLSLLRRLNRHGGSMDAAADGAAMGNHLHILKWAFDNMPHRPASVLELAAGQGHVGVYRWAKEQGCVCRSVSMVGSLFGHGYISDFKQAVLEGAVCDCSIFNAAVARGDLGVVQWLRAQGVEWDKHTCRAAIKHVHVLKWLREEKCRWGD
ncbi:hypothetical protein JKP88DRAFT_154888, partial [Tribonema minus]